VRGRKGNKILASRSETSFGDGEREKSEKPLSSLQEGGIERKGRSEGIAYPYVVNA